MAESPITILQRQRALLQTEYAYEKEEFQRLTEATGVQRKVERGMAWFPLTMGRSYHNSLDQLVVEVYRQSPSLLPLVDNGQLSRAAKNAAGQIQTTFDGDRESSLFEPGKPVCFFSEDASGDLHGTGGMLHYYKFVGQVSYVEDNRMDNLLLVSRMLEAQGRSPTPNSDADGMDISPLFYGQDIDTDHWAGSIEDALRAVCHSQSFQNLQPYKIIVDYDQVSLIGLPDDMTSEADKSLNYGIVMFNFYAVMWAIRPTAPRWSFEPVTDRDLGLPADVTYIAKCGL